MGFEKFCASCGKNTEALVNGICPECFLRRKHLFEVKDLRVTVCTRCMNAFLKGRWIPISKNALKEEVISKIKITPDLEQPKIIIELEQKNDKWYSGSAEVAGIIGGIVLDQKKLFELKLERVTCDSCMKLVSDYREAIIQIRAPTDAEAKEMLDFGEKFLKNIKSFDTLSAMTKIMKVTNGYDAWIGSKKPASKLARMLTKTYNAETKMSKKLIGEEPDRTAKFRYTYLIRKGVPNSKKTKKSQELISDEKADSLSDEELFEETDE
jgi:nonsense-mediated mRNA decay protein 3